jgi:hypothetical protein
MVPGSIPGGRIFVSKRAPLKSVREGLQIQSLFRNLIPRIPSHSYACCETASCATIMASFGFADDTLAERLRRRPAKPMGSPRVGSNPTGVVFFCGCCPAPAETIAINSNPRLCSEWSAHPTTPPCPGGLELLARAAEVLIRWAVYAEGSCKNSEPPRRM